MSPADQSSEQDGLARAGDQSPGTQLFLFGLPGLGLMAATMVAAAWFGLTGLVLLAGLVAATGLVARAWAYLSLRAVSLTASLSASRAFPGDEVRLEVEIDNAKLLPLSWLEAEIAMPAALLPGDILLGTDAKGASCLRFATALGPYSQGRPAPHDRLPQARLSPDRCGDAAQLGCVRAVHQDPSLPDRAGAGGLSENPSRDRPGIARLPAPGCRKGPAPAVRGSGTADGTAALYAPKPPSRRSPGRRRRAPAS